MSTEAIELAGQLRTLIVGACGTIALVHIGITMFSFFRRGAAEAAR